jgi:hypothetical protein
VAFVSAPWALDGALTPSSLARAAHYTATSGAEGIAQVGDLKVLPLSTPGNGVRILTGGATLLNRYLSDPDESYAVQLQATETIPSGSMPPSIGAPRSHLVCVTIGDPNYSLEGHPWMTEIEPGEEPTFQYVRPWIIQNVPAGTQSVAELGITYPALALARLDMPASTTTVQSAHIVDLRKMARPRELEEMWHVAVSAADSLNTDDTWEYWPDNSQKAVTIPEWASYVYVTGYLEGIRLVTAGASTQIASFRVSSQTAGLFTPESHAHIVREAATPAVTGERVNVNLGGPIAIPSAVRGATHNFQVQGKRNGTSSANGSFNTDTWTSAQVRLRFVEIPD